MMAYSLDYPIDNTREFGERKISMEAEEARMMWQLRRRRAYT